MAMNLPTPATQAPSRAPPGALGSLETSSEPIFFSDSGERAAPARSGTTPEMSAMLPSASARPGRSAPTEPKRTSFKWLSRERRLSGRGQARRADRFELLVSQDEFLVTERLGLRGCAAGDGLHEVEDLAADFVEFGAAHDAACGPGHVGRQSVISIRVGADLDDGGNG